MENKELAEAQALVEQAQATRQKACLQAIRDVLEKHNCKLVPRVVIEGDKVMGHLVVVPD